MSGTFCGADEGAKKNEGSVVNAIGSDVNGSAVRRFRKLDEQIGCPLFGVLPAVGW